LVIFVFEGEIPVPRSWFTEVGYFTTDTYRGEKFGYFLAKFPGKFGN